MGRREGERMNKRESKRMYEVQGRLEERSSRLEGRKEVIVKAFRDGKRREEEEEEKTKRRKILKKGKMKQENIMNMNGRRKNG